MSMIRVIWEGVDNSTWHIVEDHDKVEGVELAGVSGLVAQIEKTEVASSTGVGVEETGELVPKMTGTLSLKIFPDETAGMVLGEVHRQIKRSFSTRRFGTLRVSDSEMTEWSARARVQSGWDPPSLSPWSLLLDSVDLAVPLEVLDGAWVGEQEEHSGTNLIITNHGDLDLYPLVAWAGSGRTVTIPSGQTIALPTVDTTRHLSTDPGTGYVITDPVTGLRDTTAWASMRGQPVMGRTRTGESTTWSTSTGVTLLTRDRIENPWE